MAAAKEMLGWLKELLNSQMITPNKIEQLRHCSS